MYILGVVQAYATIVPLVIIAVVTVAYSELRIIPIVVAVAKRGC